VAGVGDDDKITKIHGIAPLKRTSSGLILAQGWEP
jgi:hypothetical protein